jgi:hypothetical protein
VKNMTIRNCNVPTTTPENGQTLAAYGDYAQVEGNGTASEKTRCLNRGRAVGLQSLKRVSSVSCVEP